MRFFNPLSQSVKRVQEADVKGHQAADVRLGNLEVQQDLEVDLEVNLGNLE